MDSGTRRKVGVAPPSGRDRLFSAAAHANLAAPVLLGLAALISGNEEGAGGIALILSLLWTGVDGVAWLLARRMSSAASSHFAQAFWWGAAALVAFFVASAVTGSAAVGVLVLAVFAIFGGIGVYHMLTGGRHRYPLVASFIEGRR